MARSLKAVGSAVSRGTMATAPAITTLFCNDNCVPRVYQPCRTQSGRYPSPLVARPFPTERVSLRGQQRLGCALHSVREPWASYMHPALHARSLYRQTTSSTDLTNLVLGCFKALTLRATSFTIPSKAALRHTISTFHHPTSLQSILPIRMQSLPSSFNLYTTSSSTRNVPNSHPSRQNTVCRARVRHLRLHPLPSRIHPHLTSFIATFIPTTLTISFDIC